MAATWRLKVDVTSDYLCPFCLLGMRQLELAIEKYRERDPEPFNLEICMRPFQLNGLISEVPMQRSEYGEKKFGQSRWNCVCDSLAAKFKSVGIEYKTDGTMSQSHLAHRLTQYATQVNPSVQSALAMDIFNLYHVNGVHLSERNSLADIGVKHGLFANRDAGLAWLAGNACDLEVKKQYQTAQRMGITGVPFFVFQDKYAASGAMGVDEFVEILADIAKREKGAQGISPTFVSGEQCPIQVGGGHTAPTCAPSPPASTQPAQPALTPAHTTQPQQQAAAQAAR